MRAGSPTTPDRPTGVFGPLADDYAAARPGYPDALFDALWVRLPPPAGRTPLILDVAAGTGAATTPLVTRGARVVALEPAVEMLGHARSRLSGRTNWIGGLGARAEQLPVAAGTADAVVIAQAFHWLDEESALAEFARVLSPGGLLAVLWNISEANAFTREVWGLIERVNPGHMRPVQDEKRETPDALASNHAFAVERPQEFAHARHLTVDEYVRYAFSWSYVGGVLAAPERSLFERELRAIFTRHHGSSLREERLVAVAHFARRR